MDCCQKVTHESDELKINEGLDFIQQSFDSKLLKIKGEFVSFCLDPYFIVIEERGVEMIFYAWVNIYIATHIVCVLT